MYASGHTRNKHTLVGTYPMVVEKEVRLRFVVKSFFAASSVHGRVAVPCFEVSFINLWLWVAGRLCTGRALVAWGQGRHGTGNRKSLGGCFGLAEG